MPPSATMAAAVTYELLLEANRRGLILFRSSLQINQGSTIGRRAKVARFENRDVAARRANRESYLRAVLGLICLTCVTVIRAEGVNISPDARKPPLIMRAAPSGTSTPLSWPPKITTAVERASIG
jgi:hypothetical protein